MTSSWARGVSYGPECHLRTHSQLPTRHLGSFTHTCQQCPRQGEKTVTGTLSCVGSVCRAPGLSPAAWSCHPCRNRGLPLELLQTL